ncbi:hypothetical protein SHEWT2_01203 [Shewanella hafniensis]|nr:hypothetical protein SHEWT2_01203 [Shewanella hafniensis]
MAAKDFDYTCSKCNSVFPFSNMKNRLTCPKCGKFDNLSVTINIIVVVVVLSFAYWMFSPSKDTSKTAPSSHQQTVNRQFSGWDGSHNGLVKFVKANLKDPSSFEHVKTQYTDKYNYLIVTMQYRGKNSFGAIVTEEVVAKTDMNGKVLEIIK